MASTTHVRARREPFIYPRGKAGTLWCYWRDERWSTGTTVRTEADRVVREHYAGAGSRLLPEKAKGISDVVRLLYDALDRRGRSQTTKDQAREKLGHFVRLWLTKSLDEIDWPLLSDYIRERLDEDKVKRLTVSHELGYLRQAWKLARAAGWVPRPWDEVMPERFDRQYVPRTRWLSPDELRAVLASLEDEHAAIVAWIVATGSDVGDLERAQAGDIDWRRKLVRVRGTKTVFRDRYVPITPLTAPLLKLAEKAGPPFEPWPWINGALRRIARLLGIPHFTPKDLRRTHGQWLRGAGVDPHLIGRVLGHADSAMADRVYAQGDELAIARLVREAIARTSSSRRRRQRKAK